MKFAPPILRRIWRPNPTRIASAIHCPVCGYPALSTFASCPSCAFEADEDEGYLAWLHDDWRRDWMADGMPWHGPSKPQDWNPHDQIRYLLHTAADELRAVHRDAGDAVARLATVLKQSRDMASTNTLGRIWNHDYLDDSRVAVEAAAITVVLAGDLCELLDAVADSAPLDQVPLRARAVPLTGVPSTPRSLGSRPAAPKFWSFVAAHLKGHEKPNGDPEQVRGAADAWHRAARELVATAMRLPRAIEIIEVQRIAEMPGLLTRAQTIAKQLENAAVQFGALGDRCDRYALSLAEEQARLKAEQNADIAADATIARIKFLPQQGPRMRLGRRIALVVAVTLTVGLGRFAYSVFGGSTVAVAIGETADVEFRDEAATVVVDDLHIAQPTDSLFQPSGALWIVTITVTGTGDEWAVNPLYFSVRTTHGEEIWTSIFNPYENDLHAQHVREGDTVRGTIAFDVPVGTTIDAIEMRGPIGGAIAEWTV